MIEYYSKTKGEEGIKKIPRFVNGSWINVINPNEEELNFLEEKFKLDKESIIDGLDIYEDPRFEIEGKKVYIYLTAPTEKISHESVSSFLVIYSNDFFMTISKYPLEILEKVFTSKSKFTTFSSSRNLLRILFSLSRTFERSVRNMMKVTKANKANLNQLKNENIVRLIHNEDTLNNYLSSFGEIIQTYNKVLRSKIIKFSKKDQEIIEDLIIDLNETLGLVKQTLKTITNMRNYYSTKLSNDLNKNVTVLTLFTIFLSIPTLIASIYGMNVNLPFQSDFRLLPILGVLVIGVWGLMFSILKKYKLI